MTSGFAVFRGVLAARELDELADATRTLTGRTRAGARHLMTHPAIAALAHDPRLVTLASRALGQGAQPYRATLFEKSSASNWLVAWHQDTALPLRARRDVSGWGPWSVKAGVTYALAPASALEAVVALRVHLDDSGPENGPLRVLPGTHTLGVLSETAVRELALRVPTHECHVARGGIITMKPLLVHASSKAASPASRRVIHIEYASGFRLPDELELAIA